MVISEPWMKIKVGDADEIDVSSITSDLEFLGEDSSPTITNNYEDNSGSDGSAFTFATFNKNVVTANFDLHFGNYVDYKLAKHDIYSLFMNKQLMRIRTDAEPDLVKYVRAAAFDIKPFADGAHDALFSIPFENPSGYKYSLMRSDELNAFMSDGVQFGMNIPSGDEIRYRFTTTSFKLFNASDMVIDPYFQRHDLKVIINFTGSSLRLVNQNNGSEWQYNQSSNGKETIVLDGINTSLNGNPASANTDYGNLTLEKGWNSIVATGATAIDITFSFPFIYIG